MTRGYGGFGRERSDLERQLRARDYTVAPRFGRKPVGRLTGPYADGYAAKNQAPTDPYEAWAAFFAVARDLDLL